MNAAKPAVNTVRAIILTSQRSGSGFLVDCLDGHPQICCFGELLIGGDVQPPRIIEGRRWPTKLYRYVAARAWNPTALMDRCYAGAAAPVVAFKVMYNHADNGRVRRYLAENKDIRVIHLRRDNLLKQHISKLLLAVRRKTERAWKPHTTTPVAAVQVTVDPANAIADMRNVQRLFDAFEELLSDHRRIELVYEQMYSGRTLTREAWSRVTGLLDIDPPEDAGSDLVKMNPDDLTRIVSNYDELSAALRGTEFERFLDG